MKVVCPQCKKSCTLDPDISTIYTCLCGYSVKPSRLSVDNSDKISEAIGVVEPTATIKMKSEDLPKSFPEYLGVYRIEEELASGAVGKVYLAKHKSLNIPVAIKILSRNISENLVTSQRFIREAQAAAQMTHINIVRILDCGIEGDILYYVMEYLKDGCVGNLLRDEGAFYSEDDALAIGQSMCRALEEAQKYDIVHRDIKPDNIMLAGPGLYKLADLGLAKSTTQENEGGGDAGLTGFQTGMGTPHYMSPEQAIDAKNVDIRADLYSLGATMYHLATGYLPFPGSDIGAVLRKHAVCPIPFASDKNPKLSTKFSHMIIKCMQKMPDDRYQAPKELGAVLDTLRQPFVAGNPIHQDTITDVSGLMGNSLSQAFAKECWQKKLSTYGHHRKVIALLLVIVVLLAVLIKVSQ